MNTKPFNGKAIYQPAGKAGEYAEYACNFYVGCSCGCTYCYNKTGRFKATLGGNIPTLKKCFKNEEHALEIFEKELQANLPELQKHGLFFSFSTDPMLPGTENLTHEAFGLAIYKYRVPVKILTKRAEWVDDYLKFMADSLVYKNHIAFGFTLTGKDELETGASTNAERIQAMRKLHDAGFKTFASIEPIIDFRRSMTMLRETYNICDLWKIGLEKGKKYDKEELRRFIDNAVFMASHAYCKIYFKDSLLKAAGVTRSELPDNCVTKDYNIWKS
jgi:DNA repair photolyase